jgi:protein-tyrosine phosphatase
MQSALLFFLIATSFAGLIPAAHAQSLPRLEAGQSLGHALGLSAATNFRDLGGYKTSAGKTVARGLVYRSDVFHPMREPDIAKLERIGLTRVYDLRTVAEIKAQPDQIPADVTYVHLDALADAQSAAPAQLGALMHHPQKATAELGGGKIEAIFADGYRQFVSLPSAQRAYRELFLSLADTSNLPAVFHCTTGKDCTGWMETQRHRGSEVINPSTISRIGALYAKVFCVCGSRDMRTPARAIGTRAGHQEAQHPRHLRG